MCNENNVMQKFYHPLLMNGPVEICGAPPIPQNAAEWMGHGALVHEPELVHSARNSHAASHAAQDDSLSGQHGCDYETNFRLRTLVEIGNEARADGLISRSGTPGSVFSGGHLYGFRSARSFGRVVELVPHCCNCRFGHQVVRAYAQGRREFLPRLFLILQAQIAEGGKIMGISKT